MLDRRAMGGTKGEMVSSFSGTTRGRANRARPTVPERARGLVEVPASGVGVRRAFSSFGAARMCLALAVGNAIAHRGECLVGAAEKRSQSARIRKAEARDLRSRSHY